MPENQEKVIGLRPQSNQSIERPARGRTEATKVAHPTFAVSEQATSYPPSEKRFSRKGLSLPTVCARTPRQPSRQASNKRSKLPLLHSVAIRLRPRLVNSILMLGLLVLVLQAAAKSALSVTP